MFISKSRFILKTCGTTTLLYAIEPLIALVQDFFPGAIVTVSILYMYFMCRRGCISSLPILFIGSVLLPLFISKASSPAGTSQKFRRGGEKLGNYACPTLVITVVLLLEKSCMYMYACVCTLGVFSLPAGLLMHV